MALVFLTGILLITYICEGALIRKSSASDFLQAKRERRDVECFFGDCSEVEETLNAPPDYEETSDVSYEGDTEQNENEEISNVLYDGNAEQTEHEETPDVSDSGTAVHLEYSEQISVQMETDVLVNDNSAQEVNGPDGQKEHLDGLGAVDGSGM